MTENWGWRGDMMFAISAGFPTRDDAIRAAVIASIPDPMSLHPRPLFHTARIGKVRVATIEEEFSVSYCASTLVDEIKWLRGVSPDSMFRLEDAIWSALREWLAAEGRTPDRLIMDDKPELVNLAQWATAANMPEWKKFGEETMDLMNRLQEPGIVEQVEKLTGHRMPTRNM